MSKKTVLAFAQRIESDASLRAAIKAIDPAGKAQALADLTAIATRFGFSFSAAELELGLDELSEMELDTVVGGGATVSGTTTGGVSSVGTSPVSSIQGLNLLIKGATYPC